MKDCMLIIEDVEMNRVILKKIFEQEYQILEAESCEEALEILEESHDDIKIILLDLILPGMSGFDFLEVRRQIDNLMEIPVVILTGSDSVENQVRGFELGATEFITKPLIPEIVRVRVNNVIEHNQHVISIKKEIEDLRTKAEIDEMTGLNNKKSTEKAIDYILRNCEGKLDVLMIIDIDYFKMVNDTLGHQVGDRVIKIIANIIFRMLRQTDIVGRIGGDEFCVLVRNVPNMEVIYTKLRELSQLMKYKPNLSIPEYITLSIGVASNERNDTTYENLFKKADEALQQAKLGGKARYCEYGVESSAPAEEDEEKNEEQNAQNDVILVVDDELIARKIVRKVLDSKYRVIEAENGLEAMKLLRTYKDKIMTVVIDLYMPIMDGY